MPDPDERREKTDVEEPASTADRGPDPEAGDPEESRVEERSAEVEPADDETPVDEAAGDPAPVDEAADDPAPVDEAADDPAVVDEAVDDPAPVDGAADDVPADEPTDHVPADDEPAGHEADAAPDADTAEPHADTAEPHADTAEPHADTAEPHADTAEPDAGGAGDEREPELARRRISSAFTTRPGRTQLMVAVLLGVLGFAAVTQVRVNENDDNYSALRQQELIDVLDALAGARQRAQSEIEQLEQTRDDLLDDTRRRQAALEQAQADVEDLNILAGLVPVTGPGIRVTVVEESGSVELDSMLDVIQELRTADAEAIQLNGTVRVVADTSFEQATGGFVVDGELVEPPYLIEAIGEPAALAGAMDTRIGAGAGLRSDGADVQIEELNSLDITAVHQPEDPQYAVPEEDQ